MPTLFLPCLRLCFCQRKLAFQFFDLRFLTVGNAVGILRFPHRLRKIRLRFVCTEDIIAADVLQQPVVLGQLCVLLSEAEVFRVGRHQLLLCLCQLPGVLVFGLLHKTVGLRLLHGITGTVQRKVLNDLHRSVRHDGSACLRRAGKFIREAARVPLVPVFLCGVAVVHQPFADLTRTVIKRFVRCFKVAAVDLIEHALI